MINQRLNEHPNFWITYLEEEKLKAELENWSRQDLISWLKWNDPNGVYDDESSLREFDNILEKEEAITIMLRQILVA
ncbi:hypothetical protein [Paucihalobacter sp.]|uniref:hypothetical protein n=1 Tax=Paucihalobacter sp. TaxID=2850405 RepID=UPI003D162166